jgi:hypothetical protein
VNELYVVKWQRGNLLNKIVNSTNLAQWYSVFKSDDLCLLLKKELDRCVFKYPARPNGVVTLDEMLRNYRTSTDHKNWFVIPEIHNKQMTDIEIF